MAIVARTRAGLAGFFDHLRRIVVLFNKKDQKIRPARLVRSRSVAILGQPPR
jgi:hypothetical protein